MATSPEILELIYATQAVAKSIEGLGEDIERLYSGQEKTGNELRSVMERLSVVENAITVQEGVIKNLPLLVVEKIQQGLGDRLERIISDSCKGREEDMSTVRDKLVNIKDRISDVQVQMATRTCMQIKEPEEISGELQIQKDGGLDVHMSPEAAAKVKVFTTWLWRVLLFFGVGGGGAAGLKSLYDWFHGVK